MSDVYCVEAKNQDGTRCATYGYSRKIEDAIAALERGKRRGVTWGSVEVRKSGPRGMRVNEWLPPFDDRRAGFR